MYKKHRDDSYYSRFQAFFFLNLIGVANFLWDKFPKKWELHKAKYKHKSSIQTRGTELMMFPLMSLL